MGLNQGRLVKQARRIVAVDICIASEAFVRRALSDFEGQLDFYLTKGDELNGICDQSIDLIFSIDCLVRVSRKSIVAYIKESARVLNPGGTLIFHLPVNTKPLCKSKDFTDLSESDIRSFFSGGRFSTFKILDSILHTGWVVIAVR